MSSNKDVNDVGDISNVGSSDSEEILELDQVEKSLPQFANQVLDRYNNWKKRRAQHEYNFDLFSELTSEQKLGLRHYQLLSLRKKQKYVKHQLLEHRRLVEIYEVTKFQNNKEEKKWRERNEEVTELEAELSSLKRRFVFQEYAEERNIELKDEVNRIRRSLKESKTKEDSQANQLKRLKHELEDEIFGESTTLHDENSYIKESESKACSRDHDETSNSHHMSKNTEMELPDLKDFIALKLQLAEAQTENDFHLGNLRRTKSELQSVLDENITLKRTESTNNNNTLFSVNNKIDVNCKNEKFFGIFPMRPFDKPREHDLHCHNIEHNINSINESEPTTSNNITQKPSSSNMLRLNRKENSQPLLNGIKNLESANPLLQSRENLINSKSSHELAGGQNGKWDLLSPMFRRNTSTTTSSSSSQKFSSSAQLASGERSFASIFSLKSCSKLQNPNKSPRPMSDDCHNAEWDLKALKRTARNDNFSFSPNQAS